MFRMRFKIRHFWLYVSFLESVLSAPTSSSPPTVTVDSGVVFGVQTTVPQATIPGSLTTVNTFLGIPFASQPVRFSPPVSPNPWSSPYNASEYGPACIQQFSYPALTRAATMAWFNTPPPPAGESEDCLNLNIYAPASPIGGLKPVMVWIYGGALTFGANSLAYYDGTSFAANQNLVIVAVNYRTNVFGFPGSPDLPLTGQNLGWLDQKFALNWVQRNIAAFGGDPKKVTIFGESAGASSVDALVTSNPINPPFRAAIMQSGQSSFYGNNANYTDPWLRMAAALNCTTTNTLSCVRAAPALTIKDTIERLALAFGPVRDNLTFVSNPASARLSGNIAPVPILTGTNAQEGRVFTYGQTNLTSFLNTTFSFPGAAQLYPLITASYPLNTPFLNNSYDQIALINTDYIFQCPAAFLANNSATAGFPTWRYYFNASFANTQLFPGAGVYHSAEIPFVFGTYPRTAASAFEARLSEFMQATWATFARNPMGGPGWGQVSEGLVAVLGSNDGEAYGNYTIGALGGDAGTGRLIRGVSEWMLDARCGLYKAIYQAIGQA